MFAGVGSGKTAMAQFRALRTGARKVLIICPASVRDTQVWEKDREKFALEFDAFEVHGYSFLQKTTDYTKYSDYYVIIDEAHKIKNSQSKQGQGAFKLCMVARGYSLLSGTPMSKWADAVNYAKITGLVKHKTEFYRKYVIEQPSYAHKGMDIVGYRNEQELARWWNSIALRGRSEEFVELPKKQIIDVQIPIKLTEYKSMLKNRMTKDEEPLDSAPKLTWALRANAESAPEKLNWVVEKAEGLENCLVFVNTIAAIETLSAKLKTAGIKHGVWYGKKKDKFEDQNVMIVQYQSGGTGLNLQKFSTTIFLSPCYSFIDYTQAVGRTYRNGQPNKCTFYHLKATNTIDGAIYAALKDKRDFDDKLVDANDLATLMGI
jgi:SNF2 family DNA or RNA helicase